MSHIKILNCRGAFATGVTVMPVDTLEQVSAAAEELKKRGLGFAKIWEGVQPNDYLTSDIVLAAE